MLFRYQKIVYIILLSLYLMGCQSGTGLRDNNNNVINFADYKGKWIVLNYWSSWCPSCVAEIPELNTFYQKHKDMDAVVLGVNYEGVNPEQLRQIIGQLNIQYPILMTDPAAKFGIQNVPVLPATYLIDPHGKLVKLLLGAQTVNSLERELAP